MKTLTDQGRDISFCVFVLYLAVNSFKAIDRILDVDLVRVIVREQEVSEIVW